MMGIAPLRGAPPILRIKILRAVGWVERSLLRDTHLLFGRRILLHHTSTLSRLYMTTTRGPRMIPERRSMPSPLIFTPPAPKTSLKNSILPRPGSAECDRKVCAAVVVTG